MNFIVTGGAGFIGSHLTEQLLLNNHNVTVVDSLMSGCLENLPKHPHLKVIQKDVLACGSADFSESIDGIAHLAASASVTESWLQPLKTHQDNLSATVAAIELCQTLKIPRLVLASSAAVYGESGELPISERSTLLPLSPYGLQKLTSEQYADLFAKKIGFSSVSLRLFNVFGPRQLANSDYSSAISIFSRNMAEDLPITIYGTGTQTRDFIYVKDVAIAFAKALMISLPSGFSLTCNIGTGKTTSILQLVDLLKHCFPNCKSEVRFAPPRLGEIRNSQADIFTASSVLNFMPQWELADALLHTVPAIVNTNLSCENYGFSG